MNINKSKKPVRIHVELLDSVKNAILPIELTTNSSKINYLIRKGLESLTANESYPVRGKKCENAV